MTLDGERKGHMCDSAFIPEDVTEQKSSKLALENKEDSPATGRRLDRRHSRLCLLGGPRPCLPSAVSQAD